MIIRSLVGFDDLHLNGVGGGHCVKPNSQNYRFVNQYYAKGNDLLTVLITIAGHRDSVYKLK